MTGDDGDDDDEDDFLRIYTVNTIFEGLATTLWYVYLMLYVVVVVDHARLKQVNNERYLDDTRYVVVPCRGSNDAIDDEWKELLERKGKS